MNRPSAKSNKEVSSRDTSVKHLNIEDSLNNKQNQFYRIYQRVLKEKTPYNFFPNGSDGDNYLTLIKKEKSLESARRALRNYLDDSLIYLGYANTRTLTERVYNEFTTVGKDRTIVNSYVDDFINDLDRDMFVAERMRNIQKEIDSKVPCVLDVKPTYTSYEYKVYFNDQEINEYSGIDIFNNSNANKDCRVIVYYDSQKRPLIKLFNEKDNNPANYDIVRSEILLKTSDKEANEIIFIIKGKAFKINLKTGNIFISFREGNRSSDEQLFQIIHSTFNNIRLEKASLEGEEHGTISAIIDNNLKIGEFEFFDSIINHPLMSEFFYISESTKPWCVKNNLGKYSFKYRDYNTLMFSEITSKDNSRRADVVLHIDQEKVNSKIGITFEYRVHQRPVFERFKYKFARIINDVVIDANNRAMKYTFDMNFRSEFYYGSATGELYTSKLAALYDSAPGIFSMPRKTKGQESKSTDYFAKACGKEKQPIPISERDYPEWNAYHYENYELMRGRDDIVTDYATGIFPPLLNGEPVEGIEHSWYACPSLKYPGLYLISMKDPDAIYPYGVCCGNGKETYDNLPRYLHFYDVQAGIVDDSELKRGIGSSNKEGDTMKFLSYMKYGAIDNDLLNNFLLKSIGNNNPRQKFIRQGGVTANPEARKSKDALIFCVLLALSKNRIHNYPVEFSDIIVRSMKHYNLPIYNMTDNETVTYLLDHKYGAEIVRYALTQINLTNYMQELYNYSANKISASLLYDETFIDPYLYYRGFEILFGIQLITFSSSIDSLKIEDENDVNNFIIEIPRCKNFHVRHFSDLPYVCIMKHKGFDKTQSKTPRCELIVYTADGNNDNSIAMFTSTSFINSLKEQYYKGCRSYTWIDKEGENILDNCFYNIYNYINFLEFNFTSIGEIKGQEIDLYGKCRTLIFNEWAIEIPPTQPLNLPIIARPPLKTRREIGEVFDITNSEDESNGVWIPLMGIKKGLFIPCKHSVVEEDKDENNMLELRRMKNIVSVYMQIVNYLYKSSGVTDNEGEYHLPPFDEWFYDNSVDGDMNSFKSLPLSGANNFPLIIYDTYEENVDYIRDNLFPEMFDGYKIIADEDSYDRIKRYFTVEYITLDGISITDPIYGRYLRPLEFIQDIDANPEVDRDYNIVFNNISHFQDYIEAQNSKVFNKESYTNANVIYDVIPKSLTLYTEPFLFKFRQDNVDDEAVPLKDSDDNVYIIQVAGGRRISNNPMLKALQIAYRWMKEKRNFGSDSYDPDLDEYVLESPYVVYEITEDRKLRIKSIHNPIVKKNIMKIGKLKNVVVKDKVERKDIKDYFQIIEMSTSNKTYGALLRIH